MAEDQDKTITFMSKLDHSDIGNTLSLKLRLTDSNNNLLSHDKLVHCAYGILNLVRDFSVFYFPNINSYKRLQ